jgi:hypothetical protein
LRGEGSFAGELVAEATDLDGAETRSPPVAFELAGGRKWLFTRLKISTATSDVRVVLRRPAGGDVISRFTYPRDAAPLGVVRRPIAPHSHVVLALGQVAGLADIRPADGNEIPAGQRNWHIVYLHAGEFLPTHWTGYDGVDHFVLPTAGADGASLLEPLLSDPVRQAALEHWLELGGHLVFGIMENRRRLADHPWLSRLVPGRVDPNESLSLNDLPDLRRSAGNVGGEFGCKLAVVQPATRSRVLIEGRTSPRSPAAIAGVHGLGRVTFLAFDIDRPPFADWSRLPLLWTELLRLRPGELATATALRSAGRPRAEAQDIGFQLAQQTETFSEVGQVSFAAVAGLMLLFILIVGPLDYLILRRLLRRMEWTWLSFPLLALAAILGSWWWAAETKGDRIRANKLDIIDLDLGRGKVYGTTWFSIFSPQAQSYTIALEAGIGCGPAEAASLSWMARPGDVARSYGRPADFAFFRGGYDFAPSDGGRAELVATPILAWSIKSFEGRWIAPVDAGKLIESDLSIIGGAEVGYLRDGLKWKLPLPLRNCYLAYEDKLWRLGDLLPDTRVEVPAESRTFSTSDLWVAKADAESPGPKPVVESDVKHQPFPGRLYQLLAMASFHHRVPMQREPPPNEFLGYLDLSPRLDLKLKEAVLIGVVDPAWGLIAAVNEPATHGIWLPSRLRISPSASTGVMQQTTMIRVLIPVRDR